MKLDELLERKKDIELEKEILLDSLGNSIDILNDKLEEIEAEIKARIGTTFEEMRNLSGKEYGVINIGVDGVHVKQTIPKKIAWDHDMMKSIHDRIVMSGKDPHDYMNISYKVYETDFKKFDPKIRLIFEPARTLKPGKPKIT
ncbi:MAG: hypothetical protein GY836_20610, partial [Herbaspirillum sp.]|uniref:hypothetical protein n=1 Tax=Herbaspirillum sp. TaxID=1890675 RepID=UPI00258F655C